MSAIPSLQTSPLATAVPANEPQRLAHSLKEATHRADRRQRVISLLLMAPVLLYGTVFFILPLAMMIYRAVDNPEVGQALPRTVAALATWRGDRQQLPGPDAFAALTADLAEGQGTRVVGELARRLNYEIGGYRTLVMKTARTLGESPPPAEGAKDWLINADERWGDVSYWAALKRASTPLTGHYLLAALDLKQADSGDIVRAESDQRIYLDILRRTLGIAAGVTLTCLLLGYPLASLLTKASRSVAYVITLAIMLPFWTSLLARTTAWIVVLQENGLINSLLSAAGIVDRPLTLIFNSTGLYIVMVHILLPFTVLPIYNSLKGIPPHLMRASASLGAHPVRGFFSVYLPLSLPGVAAGGLLTFIVAAGYYITPSLVGSAREQMLGYFVAFYANNTVNWGMASALGLVLLSCIMAVYLIAASTLGVKQLAGIK
ncbi:MAG: ABC transporter permease [Polaromonas sp.]|uniref:ABC transporter permease n=1 Tax=Polaromonas sp. TaxID=1869339 RepID=UPI002733BBF4|nr:ABC transporter permease [Polaromonas sp.]MDP3799782.1 ABC transporter permease [Polaromonas sp.]